MPSFGSLAYITLGFDLLDNFVSQIIKIRHQILGEEGDSFHE